MNEHNPVQFLKPILDLFPLEIIPQEQMMSSCRVRLEQDWQLLFVALPEGEQLIIELRRSAHGKSMFYLALRRVCLSRSSHSSA